MTVGAIIREPTTVTNDTSVDAKSVCELLRKVRDRHTRLSLTLVLDNASYFYGREAESGEAESGTEAESGRRKAGQVRY